MKSTPAGPSFRLSTPGYHRDDVDTFIRTLENERAQLQARVADLEAVALQATVEGQARGAAHNNELDRVLITGENLEKWAESGTSSSQELDRFPSELGAERHTAVTSSAISVRPPLNRSHRLALWLVSLLAGTAAVSAVLYLKVPVLNVATRHHGVIVNEPVTQVAGPSARTELQPAAASVSTPVVRPEPPTVTPAGPPVRSQRPNGGLTILVNTHDPCWIGATLDGQRKLGRLMQRGETTILHALDDVVLKAGNAGAVSLTINGLAAAPLGRQGQTVTTRITLANYMRFIEQAHR
jgi:hypothetical protein